VVVSAFEHPAVLGPAALLADEGFDVVHVRPTADGVVTPDALAEAVADGAALVSVMHANNEIGTLQDIEALADVAHRAGAYFHADCAQSVGKVHLDAHASAVDAVSFAGHKVYAPKGIGVLYLRAGTPFRAPERGGGQEGGRRSGTPDVAGAAALAEALRLMDAERAEETVRLGALRDRIEDELSARVPPVTVHGAAAPRLPQLSCMGFGGADAHDIMLHLDEAGFAVSTGSACSSSGGSISHVLSAIGAVEESARGTIRVSLGRMTQSSDVDRFIEALASIVARLRSR
jgi:cysteine desulfurase